MSTLSTQHVLSVHHWNDSLFSFRTTRDDGLRFINGQFVMLGLEQDGGRPLTRAYSIASANHDEFLEFFSIKVPGGPLTSKLQHLAVGDPVVVLPEGVRTHVAGIDLAGTELDVATTGQSVALRLADDVDVARGELIASPADAPVPVTELDATLFLADNVLLASTDPEPWPSLMAYIAQSTAQSVEWEYYDTIGYVNFFRIYTY